LPLRIGLISDTHGLLREQACDVLRGSDMIVHAGDVGQADILDRLGEVAPVVAVRGNIDTEEWAARLPRTEVLEAKGATLYILHNLSELAIDPAVAGFQIVISGHTHKPNRFEKAGVLYINPGSAGPRRFSLPILVARLRLGERPWEVEFLSCG